MNGWVRNMVLASLLSVAAAHGQEMTERHIPVGAYPPSAEQMIWAGTIASVDTDRRTVTLAENSKRRRFHVIDSTHIWLDRSRLGRTTADGSLSDARPGLRAEVRALGPGRPDTAKWLKIQVPPDG